MKRLVILGLMLAGCGTPQQNCIAGVTRDLRVMDRLIAQSEATLQRGYAISERTVFVQEFVDCTPLATKKGEKPKRRMCLEDRPQTVREPVAVDLNAEKAKLASLKAKRRELDATAKAGISQCQAQYPE